MIELWTGHTAELPAGTRQAAAELLQRAFDGDWSEHDWEHSLGGLHVLVWEAGTLIGHAAVVQRRLRHRGRALRAGYVEGVGVRADRRGRGHGAAMLATLERVIRDGYDLGALSSTATAVDFYAGRGWQRWQGPTSAFTPVGIRRTPDDDGGVYVLPTAVPLDLAGELTCDWRDGDLW